MGFKISGVQGMGYLALDLGGVGSRQRCKHRWIQQQSEYDHKGYNVEPQDLHCLTTMGQNPHSGRHTALLINMKT